MHLGPGLLSIPMAGAGFVVAGAGLALAVSRARKSLHEGLVPVVGVMGAFVFAAQMVNFPILPGTSGHLAGGFMLGLLCGWAPALVTMAAILTIQGLVFTDGGLDALGANIVNMGLLPCLMGGAVGRVWRRWGLGRAAPLAVAGAWLAVVLSAGLVVLEVWLSGRLSTSALLVGWAGSMLGVHALIGLVEGAVTGLVLVALARTEVAREMLFDPAAMNEAVTHEAAATVVGSPSAKSADEAKESGI